MTKLLTTLLRGYLFVFKYMNIFGFQIMTMSLNKDEEDLRKQTVGFHP